MNKYLKKFLLCAAIYGILCLILWGGNWVGPWFFHLEYKAPYLSYTTGNASTCIGISFETPQPCIAEVYIGTDTTYSVANINDAVPTRLHHFNFTGLIPNTEYHYIINSTTSGAGTDIFGANYMDKDFTFTTAPTSSNPQFKVGIFGDSRPDTFGRGALEVVMTELVQQSPDFIIHLGDLVYSSLRIDHWARWFDMMNIGNYAATHAFMTTIGNHETSDYGADGGVTYNNTFYYPDETLYYAYNYSNTCFISLDGAIDSILNNESVVISQAELDWLNTTLFEANASSEINWIVASIHVPIWSSRDTQYLQGDNEALKAKLWPLLDLYKVDFVLSGHHHLYERMKINSTNYIVSGGGGSEPDAFATDLSPYSLFRRAGFHYCTMEVDGLTLNFNAYDLNSVPFESMTITQNNPWRT